MVRPHGWVYWLHVFDPSRSFDNEHDHVFDLIEPLKRVDHVIERSPMGIRPTG